MNKLTIALTAFIATIVVSCAILQKGEDPLVVRTEQAEALAKANFDLVLAIDNSDRGFWILKAPRFHQFCEWLRQPTPVWQTNWLPRASAMILSVNNIKRDYIASKSYSNVLFSALITLESASTEAGAWSIIVTNTAKPE